MNRRDFLKSAFAGGALIATAKLPSFGEDDPSLFPQRGKYERLALGLKLQYFDHLMLRADSLEKTLVLGRIDPWGTLSQRRGP